jgi:type II secretory pathway component PulF
MVVLKELSKQPYLTYATYLQIKRLEMIIKSSSIPFLTFGLPAGFLQIIQQIEDPKIMGESLRAWHHEYSRIHLNQHLFFKHIRYPGFIIGFLPFIMLSHTQFIFPQFKAILESMRVPISFEIHLLLLFNDFFPLVVLFCGLFLCISFISNSFVFQTLVIKPFCLSLGRFGIFRKYILHNQTALLASMISSHYEHSNNPVESLQKSMQALDYPPLIRQLQIKIDQIEKGLSAEFDTQKDCLLPNFFKSQFNLGLRTQTLSETMQNYIGFSHARTDTIKCLITAWIEPMGVGLAATLAGLTMYTVFSTLSTLIAYSCELA